MSLCVADRAALWSNNNLELVFPEHGSHISVIGLSSPRVGGGKTEKLDSMSCLL